MESECLSVHTSHSQDIDLNSLQEAPSVLGLLLALYDEKHLGCLVAHGLSEGLCSSMQGADPITLLGGKLEGLDPDHREMLKKLLCLFRKVRFGGHVLSVCECTNMHATCACECTNMHATCACECTYMHM